MAESNEYEQKIRDMQKYVPFLESLIKKMKSNRDEKRESHLNKVEMLYGLLTNKDKKLKLETLQKCESVLVKLCEKMEKNDTPASSSFNQPMKTSNTTNGDSFRDVMEDIAAPASPSNPEPFVEYHNPIVIPTERRHTPPPPTRLSTSHHSRNSYEDTNLFDRSRSRFSDHRSGGYNEHRTGVGGSYNDHRSSSTYTVEQRSDSGNRSSSTNKQSPELFRRRSPNRERPNRFDEELWRKFESPPSHASNHNIQKTSTYSSHIDYPVPSRPRVNTVRTTYTTSVLKSPPLTLDDLKDLMNDPEPSNSVSKIQPPLPSGPAPLPPPPPTTAPLPPPVVMPPLPCTAPVQAPLPPTRDIININKESRFDPRQDPRAQLRPVNIITDQLKTTRVDPRNVNRVDPRLSREVNTIPQAADPPKQDHLQSQPPAEPPVRLAFKYNPHPRREGTSKSNEYEQNTRADDNRGINHLPSVNPSDPRLRNRQIFTPENTCPPTPMTQVNSPSGNLASPMSPLANFIDPKLNHTLPDSRNSPIYGGTQQFFGKFPTHMPQAMISTPNMFMNPTPNRFKPQAPPPQPRTYGEYRKFKQSIEHKQPKNHIVNPKKDSSFHSPLEVTVKPMEFSKETAPSVLDAMYRNTDFKKDSSSGVQSFKIPKLKKDPPAFAIAKKKETHNWDDIDCRKKSNSNKNDNKKAPTETKGDDDNWDDDDTASKSKQNQHTEKVSSDDDNWDDDDVSQNSNENANKSTSLYKKGNNDEENWDDDLPIAKSNSQIEKSYSPISEDSKQAASETEDWGDNNYDSDSSDDYFASKKHSEENSKNNETKAATNKKKIPKTTDGTENKLAGKKTPAKKANAPASKTGSSKLVKQDESTNKEIDDDKKAGKDDNQEAIQSKDPKKRKSEPSSIPNPPAKIAKKDVGNEDESTATDKDVDMSNLESEAKTAENQSVQENGEDDGDSLEGDPPDTIINSDISMKNIIEGKRRTRGSNRFHPSFQAEAASPTKTKSPGVTPPKKKQKTTAKSPDDESQECAVSSTTTTTEPTEVTKSSKADESKKEELKSEEVVEKELETKGETSSTVTKEKDEITKEWLESFLLNLFNPSQMSNSSVLAMLEKVLDANKFQQVKQILCTESPTDSTVKETAKTTGKLGTEPTASSSKEEAPKPKSKKKKNELDRLNDDIREMFICQGVLTATGRRMCTVISEKEDVFEKVDMMTPSTSAAKTVSKVTIKSKGKASAAAKPASKKKPRRGGVFWRGNKKRKRARGRSRKNDEDIEDEAQHVEDEDEFNQEEDLAEIEMADVNHVEDDNLPLAQAEKTVKADARRCEEEVLKIVVGPSEKTATISNPDSIEILDSSSDDVEDSKLEQKSEPKEEKELKTEEKTPMSGVLIIGKEELDAATKSEGAPILKAEGKFESSEMDLKSIDTREIPKLMPVVLLRRRGRPPKSKLGPDGKPLSEFKNTDPEMHSQSKYLSMCALCPFSGRHMSNHYVHAHRQSEVLISRLPPHTQAKLLENIGVAATGKIKKNAHKALFTSTCPFCEIQNSFTKVGWVDHYGTHTGEYTFKCSECNRRMNFKSEISKHIRTKCPNGQPIRLRSPMTMRGKRVSAYFCKLCNFIQMSRENIVNHLKTQHDIEGEDNVKELTLIDCSDVPEVDLSNLHTENPQPVAKHPRILDMDCVSPGIRDEVTDVERNREIFVSNDQNEDNLDTNIIQFMRDVSFSATGTSVSSSTMSVADRINERLKSVSSQGINEKFASESSYITPKKTQSMADRLSERFSRTPPDVASTRQIEEPVKRPTVNENLLERLEKQCSSDKQHRESIDPQNDTSKVDSEKKNLAGETVAHDEPDHTQPTSDAVSDPFGAEGPSTTETKANAVPSTANIDNSDDSHHSVETEGNDVIIISDCEEETKSTTTSSSTAKPTVLQSVEDSNDVTEILDDDDDWEDIETPPSPSCLDPEQKSSTADSKGRKNKTIIATLNRLYASIVQPKAKKKAETSSNIGGPDIGKANGIDRKKCEANGMQRVSNIGFVQKTVGALKYHCLVEGCSFLYSDIADGLQNHVVFEHPTLTWNGFCHICNKNVNQAQSLKPVDELNHMQGSHINCTNGTESSSSSQGKSPPTEANAQSGALKIRRLSGDVLSGQIQVSRQPASPSQLKITSAVSLNPNSDIWKPVNFPVSPDKKTSANYPIVIKSISINPTAKMRSLKLGTVSVPSPSDGTMHSEVNNTAVSEKSANKDPHPSLKLVNVETQATYKSILMPWTTSASSKSDALAKVMLREVNLFPLFKCMAKECDFTTNHQHKFGIHLAAHENQSSSVKEEPWQSCCYCLMWATNGQKLVEHIVTKHSKDIFQCAYCFYRSCEEYNVETHQNTYHMENCIKILVARGEKPQEWAEFCKLRDDGNTYLDVIKCADCTKTFVSPTEFAQHLDQHVSVKDTGVYKCIICPPANSTIKSGAMHHLNSVHGIYDNYQCVYCSYGAEELRAMELHMANVHPSNVLFCCYRPTSPDAPIKDTIFDKSGTGIAILTLRKYVEPIFLKRRPASDDDQLLTDEMPKVSMEGFSLGDPAKSLVETNAGRNEKILYAAIDIVKNTGLHLNQLYKCGFDMCDQVYNTAKCFRKHLSMHSLSEKFPCYHCGQQFTNSSACANHYLHHERHRYFCFLCFQTDRTASALALHIAKEHSIKGKSTIVTYALIKGNVNAQKDFFFVCPNSVKATDVVRFGDRLLKMWERKKWAAMKKSFTPDEMELLPRQAIFIEELYCATCQYKTKVRTNLYRHLQFHKNELNVASVDPVNPVPCLNSSEKHFDKMTNLACSSHANKPPPPATNGPGTSGGSPFPAIADTEGGIVGGLRRAVVPEFIPPRSRFACKIGECRNLALSENIFKQHLSVAHSNEKNYSCPHCNDIVCANKMCPDKVVHHMKFHDTKLYQCGRCGYLHFHKAVIEKHLSEKHPNEKAFHYIYKRTEGEVLKISSENSGKQAEQMTNDLFKPVLKWQCTLCKTRTITQNLMNAHINATHNIKYRYQCSNCNFGSVTMKPIAEHAQRKHLNVVTEAVCFYSKIDETNMEEQAKSDTTPLWRRDPNKVKNIRGILMDVESVAPLSLPISSHAPNNEMDELLDEDDEIEEPDESLVGLTPESRVCHICSHTAPDIASMRAHIAEMHDPECKHLNMIFKFFCAHCRCGHNTFAEFLEHWARVHEPPLQTSGTVKSDHKEGRAAWFTVSRRFRCSRCTQTNDYRELAIHHFLEHPKANFAVHDIENELKCGHCAFEYDGDATKLSEHYKNNHSPATDTLSKSPIPPAPSTPLTKEHLRDLVALGKALQLFKCNICHVILYNMNACKSHCVQVHDITANVPCTILQGMIYKCPTCQYCSSVEGNVAKHIATKLKNNNFKVDENIAMPEGLKETLWPFVLLHVIFPNGLLIEKYRLLGTQFGSLQFIENSLKRQQDATVSVSSPPDIPPVDAASDSKIVPKNSIEKGAHNSPSTPLKRHLDTNPTSTPESVDDLEEPIKKSKLSVLPNAASGDGNIVSMVESSPSPEQGDQGVAAVPTSSYGNKPEFLDLGSIIANVIVDGVKVMIPAKDFHKVFKKAITLKLQKVNIDEMRPEYSKSSRMSTVVPPSETLNSDDPKN